MTLCMLTFEPAKSVGENWGSGARTSGGPWDSAPDGGFKRG